MTNKTTRILSPFILVPSFLEARIKANNALIEQCGLLCSVKDFQSVKTITGLIDTPVARLYETIAENDYSRPESFIIENIGDSYRSRVLLSVAIGYRLRGDLQSTGKLLIEASKTAKKYNNTVTYYQIRRELAILHSLSGNHETALEILKATFKLAQHVYNTRPAFYFAYLNSLAVELCEVGQVEKARYFIDLALASPFAPSYPEWHDTGIDIERKGYRASRSIVVVANMPVLEPENVVHLDAWPADRAVQEPPSKGTARVRDFAEWKTVMAKGQKKVNLEPEKKAKKENKESLTGYDELKKRTEIYRLISDTDLTPSQLDRLLDLLRKFADKKAEQE